MIVLGIDSSTDRLGIGLADSQTVLGEKILDSSREHASRIIGLIDEVLTEASVTKEKIGGLAVAIGPGSFTGLRVGLAAAKGMAVALKIPIVGISTFEVLARRLRGDYPEFFLSGVVRKGEYYLCRIKPDIDILRDIEIVGEDDLPQAIGSLPAGLVGRESAGVWEKVTTVIPPEKLHISGGELALCGAERIAAGKTDKAATLEPLYIAPSQAEKKFGQR